MYHKAQVAVRERERSAEVLARMDDAAVGPDPHDVISAMVEQGLGSVVVAGYEKLGRQSGDVSGLHGVSFRWKGRLGLMRWAVLSGVASYGACKTDVWVVPFDGKNGQIDQSETTMRVQSPESYSARGQNGRL